MSRWSCRFAPTLGVSCDYIDAVLAQIVRRPDAREHQHLRRIDRTAADDDFARCGLMIGLAAHRIRHAAGTTAIEGDATDQRAGMNGEIRALFDRREVRGGRRTARAIALGDLIETDAVLLRAVEIAVHRQAVLMRGIDEHLRQRIGVTQVGHRERTFATVQCVAAALIGFRFTEIRQHVVPLPTFSARRGPVVVIAGDAADVAHRVDRTGAAKHFAARPPECAVVELRFGDGVVVPIHAFLADQLR